MKEKTTTCPACSKKKLIVVEVPYEIPYFGKVRFLTMNCTNCKYRKNEVETEGKRKPAKYRIEIGSPEDLSIRVVKDSQATVSIPGVIKVESSPASNGYITNIEGVLIKLKNAISFAESDLEDESMKKKARVLEKKIDDAIKGKEKLVLEIDDIAGNSAIISDKAERS